MPTREDTGQLMLDALLRRRADLVVVLSRVNAALVGYQASQADRAQLLLDIKSIDDEIASLVATKGRTPVVLPPVT
jgi:hypothetical protein